MLRLEQATSLFKRALMEFARDWEVIDATEITLTNPDAWQSGLGTFGFVLRSRATGAIKVLGRRKGPESNATFHRGVSFRVLEGYDDGFREPVKRYLDEIGAVGGPSVFAAASSPRPSNGQVFRSPVTIPPSLPLVDHAVRPVPMPEPVRAQEDLSNGRPIPVSSFPNEQDRSQSDLVQPAASIEASEAQPPLIEASLDHDDQPGITANGQDRSQSDLVQPAASIEASEAQPAQNEASSDRDDQPGVIDNENAPGDPVACEARHEDVGTVSAAGDDGDARAEAEFLDQLANFGLTFPTDGKLSAQWKAFLTGQPKRS